MLQILFPLKPNKLRIKQVYSCFSIFLTNHNFTSASPSSSNQLRRTQIDFSSIDFSNLAKSVILRCPHLFDRKDRSFVNSSLKELLFEISSVVPEISRRFRRFSALNPENVLELLLEFEYECQKGVITTRKIEALWGIFNWGSNNQAQNFQHLPRSYEVMASLLIKAGMFREVKLLLLAMERKGMFLGDNEILGDFIRACIGIGDEETAIWVFDKMVEKSLVLPSSCFNAVIEVLVARKITQLVFRVCSHRVETGVGFSRDENRGVENVVVLLCREGRIREARYLIKKGMASGIGLSSRVVNEIARGYCEKKDFDDLLKFLVETKQLPDITVGNKIIHTICKERSVETADLFRQEMEDLGFGSDQVTFGILISWSCYDGNLRDAFIYLSEIFSRGLKPDVFSYNAILSAMFKNGMWKNIQSVIDEMVERGTKPDFTTFRVLLAGFCKARRFDEVKKTISQMMNQGFVELSSLDDPLSRAFAVLELSPAVKLKRDNDVKFSRAEFFDKLGNGLYLDTDTDDFDKRVTEVLEDSMIPDFSCLVTKECARENFKVALEIVDRMSWWGQELSPCAFSNLVKGTATSRSSIRFSIRLLKKMPKLANQLDEETCNFLVQAYCKRGLTLKARSMFYEMLQNNCTIESETYTALIKGVSKKGSPEDLRGCWEIARENKWLPAFEDFKDLLECICHRGMVKEALELTENMFAFYLNSRLEILDTFLDNFCSAGFTSAAEALVEELQQQGFIVDSSAYSILQRGFRKEKRFSDAFISLNTSMAKTLMEKPSGFSAAIRVLCRKGKLGEALESSREIESRGLIHGSAVQNVIAGGLLARSKFKEAESFLERMVDKGLIPDSIVYDNLIKQFCSHGRLIKAVNLLNVMLKKGNLPNSTCYDSVIEGFCSRGDLSRAIDFHTEMLDLNLNPSIKTMEMLVDRYCKEKRTSEAEALLNCVVRLGQTPTRSMYNAIIASYRAENNVKKASELLQMMQRSGYSPDFDTQWSLISNLSSSKDDNNQNRGFLSRLLSGSGFSWKKNR